MLCVCSTRPKTRYLADQIARRFAPLEPLPQPIKNIIDLIDQSYPYLRPLKEALQRGVAYHNFEVFLTPFGRESSKQWSTAH